MPRNKIMTERSSLNPNVIPDLKLEYALKKKELIESERKKSLSYLKLLQSNMEKESLRQPRDKLLKQVSAHLSKNLDLNSSAEGSQVARTLKDFSMEKIREKQ